MIAKTSTYPKGQHWKLDAGDIVQRVETVAGRKRFRDCYVHELTEGDEYWMPEPSEDTPRTGDVILSWMEENGIENNIDYDIDGKPESIELCSKVGQTLVTYPYGKGCLREACEFIMDLEEERVEHTEEDLAYLIHRNERGCI